MNRPAHPLVGGVKSPAPPATIPSWADTPTGRELIAAIVAECPERRYYDNGCSAWGGSEYCGRNANALRRLYNDALAVIADKETALFEAGEPYGAVHDQLTALLSGERPDALIERVLAA